MKILVHFFFLRFENKYENTNNNIEYETIMTNKIIFCKIWPGYNVEIIAVVEIVTVIITARRIISFVWSSLSSKTTFSFFSERLLKKNATSITANKASGIARSRFAIKST